MIIKGKARGRARQLARHLSDIAENEQIAVHSTRGTIATDIHGALAEMDLHAKRGRSAKPLYHASISPDPGCPLSNAEVTAAADLLEAKLGLTGQPRLIVGHRKLGRAHVHVVWLRIREDGTAVSDSWSYVQHEAAARALEHRFGHRSIMGAHGAPRPGARRTREKEWERRQTRRSGLSRNAIAEDVLALWKESGSGKAFHRALEERGYSLVRGDRRGFVVLDSRGEAHSLARLLHLKTRAVNQWMRGVESTHLPAIADARRMLRQRNIYRHASSGQPSFAVHIAVFARSHGPAARHLPLARPGTQLAAALAALRNEFASRIADICAYAPRMEIRARVDRLKAEEVAARTALLQRSDHTFAADLRPMYRAAAQAITRRVKRFKSGTIQSRNVSSPTR